MLDYYSDYSPPSNDEIILSISKEISELHPYKPIRKIKNIVENQLIKIGRDSLGSLSGYLVFGRRMLLLKCISKLYKSKLSFKTICNVIIACNRLYRYVLHERYKPDGIGYVDCLNDYYSHVSYLPPIGTKPLPIPIKEYK